MNGEHRDRRPGGQNRGERPAGKGRGGPKGADRKGDRKGRDNRKEFHGRRDSVPRDRSRDDRRGQDRRPPKAREESSEPRLTVPSTPEKILFKGIDCEVNGRSDLAMVLYLHGAAKLSGGCESNVLRMLRDAGRSEFRTIRGRVAKSCPEEVMVVYDYLCTTLDPGYDDSFLRSKAESQDPLAIYCLIRLDEVDGEDPMVDSFAKAFDTDEKMVEEGMKRLVRKKDSVKAKEYIASNEKRRTLRQSVRTTFVKSMQGDAGAAKQLAKLSDEFAEAAFLVGYLDAYNNGNADGYLREGMAGHRDLIISMANEFGIPDTPFGRYISAKKLQVNDGEWIQPMIAAYREGSEEAMDELRPVQNRRDVKKALSSIYLEKGDAEALVRCFDGEDTSYLDQYCSANPARVLEVAGLMGGVREIDWLKRGCIGGNAECRDALVALAQDESRRCKQLVYALHDVGAELESAKLYFAMGDDPSLPAVKWLRKVCADEEAKEFVRSVYEVKGDMATFDYIFEDDGYESRGPRGRGRPSGGRSFDKGKGGRGRGRR